MLLEIQRDTLPPSVWVVTHPPALPPASPDAYMDEMLAVTPPAGGRAVWGEAVPFTTDLGWTAVRVDGEVVDVAGAMVEQRVAAIYSFTPFLAAVIIVGQALDRAAVDAVLRSVRPDFSGDEAVALPDLWR